MTKKYKKLYERVQPKNEDIFDGKKKVTEWNRESSGYPIHQYTPDIALVPKRNGQNMYDYKGPRNLTYYDSLRDDSSVPELYYGWFNNEE